ncbi:MAG: hypothetical protein KDI82_07565 [Gammaproteobacteria bacterium]|nr:hypothetical protein [Gammaproteobacteria bacterium]
MILTVVLALAPALAPAQMQHAVPSPADLTAEAAVPPCHAQPSAQEQAVEPGCPHCDRDHLSGCTCCDHTAPSGVLPAISVTVAVRFTVDCLRVEAVDLPLAPSEDHRRPPIANPA